MRVSLSQTWSKQTKVVSWTTDTKVIPFTTGVLDYDKNGGPILENLGLKSGIITKSSAKSFTSSLDVRLLLIGPEVMQIPSIMNALVDPRATSVCKDIDQAYLGKKSGWKYRKCDWIRLQKP